jgi:hypothetical protein
VAVAALVAVTLALTSAAPDVSVAVPEIVAVSACPHTTETQRNSAAKQTNSEDTNVFAENREFMSCSPNQSISFPPTRDRSRAHNHK